MSPSSDSIPNIVRYRKSRLLLSMINRVNWEYWFVLTGYMYTLTNIVDASLSEMNKYHFYQDQH